MIRPVTHLGDASTRWNDYLGTSAADDAPATSRLRSLYSLAGLDRDEWTIVAIDVKLRDAVPAVVVYAARAGDLEATDAELPVAEFRLGDSTEVESFLNEAFREVTLRLVAKPFLDRRLELTAAGNG